MTYPHKTDSIGLMNIVTPKYAAVVSGTAMSDYWVVTKELLRRAAKMDTFSYNSIDDVEQGSVCTLLPIETFTPKIRPFHPVYFFGYEAITQHDYLPGVLLGVCSKEGKVLVELVSYSSEKRYDNAINHLYRGLNKSYSKVFSNTPSNDEYTVYEIKPNNTPNAYKGAVLGLLLLPQ